MPECQLTTERKGAQLKSFSMDRKGAEMAAPRAPHDAMRRDRTQEFAPYDLLQRIHDPVHNGVFPQKAAHDAHKGHDEYGPDRGRSCEYFRKGGNNRPDIKPSRKPDGRSRDEHGRPEADLLFHEERQKDNCQKDRYDLSQCSHPLFEENTAASGKKSSYRPRSFSGACSVPIRCGFSPVSFALYARCPLFCNPENTCGAPQGKMLEWMI